MRKGWDTVKMSEAFVLQMGKTPSRDNPDYWHGNETWVSISDMGDSKYISTSREMITPKAIKESGIKLVPQDCVIMSFKLSVGKVAITQKALYTNEAIMSFLPQKGYPLSPHYVYYYLKGYKWDGVNRAAMGQTLNKATISQGTISFPSLPKQERIVAELDLLQGIIDKQKAQLKELDTLAQSIFYDMFGDPIENDKGWPKKRLEDICENLDYLRKPITASEREKGSIPYYGASGIVDYVKDYIFDGDYLLVSEDGANLQMRHTPIAFSISGKTWVNNHAHVLLFSEKDIQRYVESFIALFDISEFLTGAVQPKLTQAKLNSIQIPLPPQSLQHAFAAKIGTIEHQKSLINQSIAETQKLFDYTMDKYFG